MKNKFSQHGFSIPEAVFAMGIGAIAVAGGMVVNQEQLRMVKSARQASGSFHLLEERVEQLRIASWRQITDSAYLKDTYFKVTPKSAKPLGSYVEYVSITAFPDASACAPLELERSEDGSVRLVSGGTGFDTQRLAKVTVGVTWKGNSNRARSTDLATVISNGGISRMNLPSMGAGFGGTLNGATAASTETTTGSASPTTAGTTEASTSGTTGGTTTTTTTTTPTTETITGNNGNGHGRGNVAGKSGKA
jgi:hypothetical protein